MTRKMACETAQPVKHPAQRPMPGAARPLAIAVLLAGLAACDTASEMVSPMVAPAPVEEMVAESPVTAMADEAAAVSARGAALRKHGPAPRRGVITAGDIDDTLNLAAFRAYQARAARETGLPRVNLSGMLAVQLVGPDGRPAPGVPITLRRPGAAQPFYSGYSGVDGRIAVVPTVHGARAGAGYELRAFGPGQGAHSVRLSGQPRVTLPFQGGWSPEFLDLAFVFDTTGSMGDELAWLTREFAGIVRAAKRAAPGASIRFGLVAYRDQGDRYVVRNFGFTAKQSEMQGWLRRLDAAGGGDYPEAAAQAMQAAAGLNWRRGAGERLLFHIADAPAHKGQARAYLNAARKLAVKNVQIFGLGASGVGAESEFLMRQAAVQARGRYLFLTDDSGIGLAHAEPSIACYRVTRLRSLLARVLASELTGQRKEAARAEVIRTVGSYRGGVCRQ